MDNDANEPTWPGSRGRAVTALRELVVELTDRCPLMCVHCSSRAGPTCRTELSGGIVAKILAEAADLDTSQVSFGGGEPAIAPLFLEALREAIRLGLSTEIFTCGAMLSADGQLTPFPDKIVREFRALGTNLTLVFSLHGSCSTVHDSVTKTDGSFACLKESLRKCMAYGISCAANFVPMRINAADFLNTASLVESLGVEKLSILRFVPQGRGWLNRRTLELSRAQEDCVVEEILGLRNRTQVRVRTGSPFNGIIPGNDVPCRAGFQKLVVQPSGNVIPCEVFKKTDRSDWGASVYQMGLRQILSSPRFLALRQALSKSQCSRCPVHGVAHASRPDAEAIHGVSRAAVYNQ